MICVGIVSCNRYYHIASTLLSLKNARIKDPYYCILDDKSDKKVLDLYSKFNLGNNTDVIVRTVRRGLPGLADAFRSIIANAVKNKCEHVFLIPDDVVFNRYLGKCVEKAKKMFKDGIEAIQFFRDSRGSVFYQDKTADFDDSFHVIGGVDGFGVLMRTEYANSLDWSIDQEQADRTGRSLIWHKIADQMRDKTILEVNDSLIEHTGNFLNATTGIEKFEHKKIWAVNLNMFRRPAWLD